MTTKTNNVRLAVMERFALLDILPTEGHYGDLKLVRKFRESLSFSEEEQKTLVMRPKDGDDESIVWEGGKDPNKAIYFGRRMETIIVNTLVTLENSGKLKDEHLSLYEKFVGGDEGDDE